jgi:hypothetical protein
MPSARPVAGRTAGAFLVGIALACAVPALASAAGPTPTPGAAGDPRSSGAGPGLVGDPLWAVGIVVAIAVLTLVATLVYVRATANRTHDSDHEGRPTGR